MAKRQSTKKQPVVNIAEPNVPVIHVPRGGVFGRLDQQMNSVMGELALNRMNAPNELAEIEAETTRIITDEVIPVARQRQSNIRKLIVQRGFAF